MVHKLNDGSFCNGQASDDAPADFPPSQATDLAKLQAAVAAEGLTWENFQRDHLKMVWAEWLKLGGTVAGAWERIPLRLEGG